MQRPEDELAGDASPAQVRRPATDAEARALASSLRLRILRMCLDEPLTNARIAERLGRPPASVLHHVRTLVETGFLEALPTQQGVRGSRPRPYRATRKSWFMEHPTYTNRPMVEAFVAESALVPTEDLTTSRLGLRLDAAGLEELRSRLDDVLQDFAARPPTSGGRPWSVFLSVHPDPDRD
ncbi:ArsR/SmtB family transcription factor [Aquipuribacter sp. MA13-6]|uniref:ArsR/SmtB family transcription factor n=1 Tax=unclassified Aquipuribacter TaxID=2635084 RepID=UPI003EEECC41